MTNQAAETASMQSEGRGRWLGLAMLSLGVSMIIVDATIVNVAVPSIIRDLKLDSTAAEWVNAIYTLVFAALLVTLGRMGDVLGRRALYLGGLVLFVLASMVAGVASSGEMLIGARLVQGLGGAMILPATQSILNDNFRGRDRAIAFGIWGAVIGGMAAIGPLLGGWLTTNLSWRWAFFLNLPVGILAIIGTLVYIRESRDEDSKLGFDLPGFILITLGLGGIVFGLIEGRTYGWWALNASHPFGILDWRWPLASISVVPIAIGVGVAATVLFAIVEIRRQRAERFFLFDFSLWGIPGIPLRQPRRHDREPRGVRPAVLAAALPPGGHRLQRLRDGARLPGPRPRLVRGGAARGDRRPDLGSSTRRDPGDVARGRGHPRDDVPDRQGHERAHACRAALRVRDRRGPGNGAADQHRALGDPGEPFRARVGDELHDAPGGLGPWRRDPRHGPVRVARRPEP
jgi:MFS family permease